MLGSGYFPLKSLGKEESALVWRVRVAVRSSSRSGSGGLGKWRAGAGGSLGSSEWGPDTSACREPHVCCPRPLLGRAP